MKGLIMILLFIPIIGYSQTCIVAIKRNDTIMVGADSRVSQAGYDTKTWEPISRYADTSCKIISNGTGDINFSLSGYEGVGLRNLAQKIMDTAKTINAFEMAYKSASIDYIFDSFRKSSIMEMKYVDTSIKMGYTIMDAVVFGRKNDSLVLHYIALKRKKTDSSFIGVEWQYQNSVDSVAFGEWQEIYNNHLFSNRDVWKYGLKKGIEYLINFAHEYHPDHVGGPINVVMVTKRKTMWLDKKPPCY